MILFLNKLLIFGSGMYVKRSAIVFYLLRKGTLNLYKIQYFLISNLDSRATLSTLFLKFCTNIVRYNMSKNNLKKKKTIIYVLSVWTWTSSPLAESII